MALPYTFLSGSENDALKRADAVAKRTQRQVEKLSRPQPGDFPASLTSYDGTKYYAWTRRAWDTNYDRTDAPEDVSGTETFNPAMTMDGSVIDVTSPADVWLRPVAQDATLGVIHEVISVSASSSGGGSIGSPEELATNGIIVSGATSDVLATITFTETGLYQVAFAFVVICESLVGADVFSNGTEVIWSTTSGTATFAGVGSSSFTGTNVIIPAYQHVDLDPGHPDQHLYFQISFITYINVTALDMADLCDVSLAYVATMGASAPAMTETAQVGVITYLKLRS